jgi:trehalose-6-phosphate hydrolase
VRSSLDVVVCAVAEPWWQRCVVYQIYPRSFKDATADGVGDLQGIREKLDYLKALGVDAIWMTPIYDSPQRDHGYDISDYRSIYAEYGSMADFDQLLADAHERGLRIILDMVVNHTSTAHAWFEQARQGTENLYHRFYIWQDGEGGQPPNNWESKFGGSAWELDPQRGQYYLHLFDVTQADLNWESVEVRESVYELMRFWLDKGVDGFRLDVINLISKHQAFPNDEEGAPGAKGRQYYTDGPRVHEFLHEMNREVFSRYDMMTVGEMSSTTIANCIQYSNPERQELNMAFSFHHLKVDYPQGQKWAIADVDFGALKRILTEWQVGMNKGRGWNALFWCNHDQPRIVSRYGDDGRFRRESAKMLATALHMLQGTPFVYQGEEIGMTNPHFSDIADYQDVESLNVYKILTQFGEEPETVLRLLSQRSRDNARTPMQWDDTEYAGFSEAMPWIKVAPNYQEINVANALADGDSVLHHYRKLFALRKQHDVVVYGDYQLLLAEHPEIFAYVRTYGDERLLVVNNFYGRETVFSLPPDVRVDGSRAEILISNYGDSPASFDSITLRPYESIVYRVWDARA